MELEMSEMVELPNQSVGDNGVAGSERTEMSELMDVGINEWMGCTDIETVRLLGFLCLERLIMKSCHLTLITSFC